MAVVKPAVQMMLARRSKELLGTVMKAYDPYFAADTDGVHFLVEVDGLLVQGYVSRRVLQFAYGVSHSSSRCLSTYLEHRAEIDAAVRSRVAVHGPECVLVRRSEIGSKAFGTCAVRY